MTLEQRTIQLVRSLLILEEEKLLQKTQMKFEII